MKLKKAFTAIALPCFKRKETDGNHDNCIAYGMVSIWLLLTMLLHLTGRAQPIVPLKVGDTVPDMELTGLLNDKTTTFKFADAKGKLLILDFWATWCSSCLHHFPATDSLQKEFPGDIQIILVDTKSTKDSRERVLNTLNHFPGFSLPSLFGDTILDQLFPHYALPHYVWIDRDGVVRATTAAEELNVENVRRFLNDGTAPSVQKNDFDPSRPLYTIKDLPLTRLQQYSILLKGKIDGIGGGGLRRINDTIRGIILHNRSLFSMYQSVVFHKLPGFSDNRIVLAVKDPSRLYYTGTRQLVNDWERENFYSYELILPPGQFEKVYDDLLTDLNRYTPYASKFEKQKLKCWILQAADRTKISVSRGEAYLNELDDLSNPRLRNAALLDLCAFINKRSGDAVILDETRFTGNVDLEFRGPVKDMADLQRKLKPFGLRLFQAWRDVDMLVIRDKPSF